MLCFSTGVGQCLGMKVSVGIACSYFSFYVDESKEEGHSNRQGNSTWTG